jgi:hypothetical protein
MVTCEAYYDFVGWFCVGDRPGRRRRGLSESWSSEEAEATFLPILSEAFSETLKTFPLGEDRVWRLIWKPISVSS